MLPRNASPAGLQSRIQVTDQPRHLHFRDLPDLLAPGDLLVTNRSRVLPARILARRASGGAVEVLLLRQPDPVPAPGPNPIPSPSSGHAEPEIDPQAEWEALLRPGGRIRLGETLLAPTTQTPLVTVLSPPVPGNPRRRVRLECGDEPAGAWLDRVGQPPLPPYIQRPPSPADRDRYQTIYARERGSVAAPTAGLHFTAELLERLERRGVERAEIVLHVGLGTFRPVEVAHIEDHRVDPERMLIPPETLAAISKTRQRGGRIVAVGTTSVRALESAAAPGQNSQLPSQSQTDLVVLPGYRFRVADALITNFHLPKSSLLLLVSAFAGRERVLAAYEDAIRLGYRFYSYGDAMLIL